MLESEDVFWNGIATNLRIPPLVSGNYDEKRIMNVEL